MSIALVKCSYNRYPADDPCGAWQLPYLSDFELASGMSEKIPRWAVPMLNSLYLGEINAGRGTPGHRLQGSWLIFHEKGGRLKKGNVAYYVDKEFKKHYTVITD
jgi:hypothetical protein